MGAWYGPVRRRPRRVQPGPVVPVTDWQRVNVGGGGFINHGYIAPDGSMLIGTDVSGGYWRLDHTKRWQQVITAQSLVNLSEYDSTYSEGLYASKIAPSNTDVAYIIFSGYCYRCANIKSSGRTWTKKTNWPRILNFDGGVGAITAGQTVVGQTSGATGVALRDASGATGFLALTSISGTFQDNENLQVSGVTKCVANGVLTVVQALPNSGPQRLWGSKLDIDPNDANKVIVGTQIHGMYRTADGGDTWVAITDVALSTASDGSNGHNVRYIDSNTVVAFSHGIGSYRSTNGGAAFSALTGGPTGVRNMDVAVDGDIYAIGLEADDNVWKLVTTTWTRLTSIDSASHWGVACNPDDAEDVVVCGDGTYPTNRSLDGGTTWLGNFFLNFPTGAGIQAATDIGWFVTANNDYLSNSGICFDPTQSNKIYNWNGVGVCKATIPLTYTGNWTWDDDSVGIEELVGHGAWKPVGGAWNLFGQDRGNFYLPNIVATTFPSTQAHDASVPIAHCWEIAQARSDASFLAGIFNYFGVERSGYSTNGGQTWSLFSSKPAPILADGRINGCMVAFDSSNILWFLGNGSSAAYRTTDGGVNWSTMTFPGSPTAWSSQIFAHRHIAVLDWSTAGKAFAYNSNGKLYVTTDFGANWSDTGTTLPNDVNAKLLSPRGTSGHLFYSIGPSGGVTTPNPDTNAFLHRSTNGSGTSFSTLANVREIYCMGDGAIAPGHTYPAIAIVAWVDYGSGYEYGIHVSKDADQATPTWKKIGDFPVGIVNQILGISGDPDEYGTWVVGFNGEGWAVKRDPSI